MCWTCCIENLKAQIAKEEYDKALDYIVKHFKS